MTAGICLSTRLRGWGAWAQSVLPAKVLPYVERGRNFCETFSSVTVLFSDIVSYTSIASEHPPMEVYFRSPVTRKSSFLQRLFLMLTQARHCPDQHRPVIRRGSYLVITETNKNKGIFRALKQIWTMHHWILNGIKRENFFRRLHWKLWVV